MDFSLVFCLIRGRYINFLAELRKRNLKKAPKWPAEASGQWTASWLRAVLKADSPVDGDKLYEGGCPGGNFLFRSLCG